MKQNKKFFFMAGLARSGGTLISSILNQNTDIYVSPQSVLPNTIGAAYNQYQSNENKDSSQFENIFNVMEIIIPTFYNNNSQKYIIDRNFNWLSPHPYIVLEKHLKNEIKVICPVRDILGILASWNNLCEKDLNNEYDKEIRKNYKDNRAMADRRADYFYNKNILESDTNSPYRDLQRILYPEFKNKILLVEYDELTLNTKETIDNIYNFLNIEKFDHNYNQLSTPHEHTDHWGIKNHHTVKPKIERENYDYSKIFSKDIIKKYSGLEFWRDKNNYKY